LVELGMSDVWYPVLKNHTFKPGVAQNLMLKS